MVTILFSDVIGSTAMAEELDPEDVMEIMDGASDVLIEPTVRYEGTVARLMEDVEMGKARPMAKVRRPLAQSEGVERRS